MNDTHEVIHHRTSTQHYDPTFTLSDAEIRELIAEATEAPSSFNIQHWRFVAVTDMAKKEQLRDAAMGQQQVVDAAVAFIVLGDLEGHRKLNDILERNVEAGIMAQGMADTWAAWGAAKYDTDAVARRDEAIRSGALSAMILMLAARAKGLSSGPMIGFDAEQVKKSFDISNRYLPVMLVTVGKSAPGNMKRKIRLGVDEVLSFNRARIY